MKRKLLVAALILIIAGAAVFLIGFIVNGSAPSPLFTAEERTIVIEEPFTDIAIDAGSCNITIEKTDGQARVETKLCGALNPEIDVKDGVLTVSTDEYMHFGLHSFSDRITVYLPDGRCASAVIDVTSGSVEIGAVSFSGQLKAETTSGSVKLDAVSCEGELSARTTSGAIRLNAVSCGSDLTLETTSGSIKLNAVSCEGEIKVQTTSGSIALDAVSTPAGTALTATSGSVTVKDLTAAHLDAKTTSGSIKLDRCDALTLNLTTTSGSVKGSVVGERIFECSTGSGSVHVPETTEGGKCVIKTGSGSIHMEIAE